LECRSFFFFSSRRRHTRFSRDWSSDVCSSDLVFRVQWLPLTCLRKCAEFFIKFLIGFGFISFVLCCTCIERLCSSMVSRQSLAHRLWCRTAETVAYGNEMLWRNQFFKFYLIKRRFAPRCCMECRKERCKAVFLKSATLSHHGTCYSRCNLMRLT